MDLAYQISIENKNLLVRTTVVGDAKIIATEIRQISRIIITDMPTISFFLLAKKNFKSQ